MPLSHNSPEAIYVLQYCNKHFPNVDFEDGEPYLLLSGELDMFLAKYDAIVASLPKNFNKGAFHNFIKLQKCIARIDWGEDAVERYANQEELKQHITLSKEQRASYRKEAFWGFLVFLYFSVKFYEYERILPDKIKRSL